MSYIATRRLRTDAGIEHTAVMLEGDGAMAELWPGLGGNTVRWAVPVAAGTRDLLYSPAPAELFARPTRGGVPVLFPFPNRIRSGQFSWGGQKYHLAPNDPARANAIHGYTPRRPWRIADLQGGVGRAWCRIEFSSADATDERVNWPADYHIALTIELAKDHLRYTAEVTNPDTQPLPFGLGYHPYFSVSPDCLIQTPARARWSLIDNLPTGSQERLAGDCDLSTARSVSALHLDDVYTDFPPVAPDRDGLVERGRVEYPGGGVLCVRTSPSFRELVLFTPPHRQAVCLEPYTCPTDAVNLHNVGQSVGWQVLRPGGTWSGVVEFRWPGA